MVLRLLTFLLLLAWADTSQATQMDRSLRVRILANRQVESVEFVSIGTDSLRIVEDGQTIAVLAPEEPAVVEQWQGMLRVKWSRGSAPLTRCEFQGANFIQITADGRQPRLYRGTFEAILDGRGEGGLQIVNVVNIEHYVASVLPAEYPFEEIEGVKAQAIVIRTYAITAAPRNGSAYSLRDDAGSQVYRGVETETDLSREVARLTAGTTLIYRNEPIEAVYSSHCGSHSADNEDIWGTDPIPYLRGRKDPYDHEAPVAEWSTSADVNEVHERLSDRLGKQVRALKVAGRGAGKHVREVQLKFKDAPDETMRGERFRAILNAAFGTSLLQSSSFEINKRSDTYRFKGKGNGHGVGFCQWGARAQAQEGRSYEDILKFYYKDVDVLEGEPEAIAFLGQGEAATGPVIEPAPSSEPREMSPKPPMKRRPGW